MFNDSEKQWFRVKVGCGSGRAADELISNHTHYGPIDKSCLFFNQKHYSKSRPKVGSSLSMMETVSVERSASHLHRASRDWRDLRQNRTFKGRFTVFWFLTDCTFRDF